MKKVVSVVILVVFKSLADFQNGRPEQIYRLLGYVQLCIADLIVLLPSPPW